MLVEYPKQLILYLFVRPKNSILKKKNVFLKTTRDTAAYKLSTFFFSDKKFFRLEGFALHLKEQRKIAHNSAVHEVKNRRPS